MKAQLDGQAGKARCEALPEVVSKAVATQRHFYSYVAWLPHAVAELCDD